MIQILEDIQPDDIEVHGGKSVNLVKLHHLGFIIPKGFSVSSTAFVQMVESCRQLKDTLQSVDESDEFEEILKLSEIAQNVVAGYRIPEYLESEISEGFDHISESNVHGFAVRSSATIEDSRDISFAGQAESFLCLKDKSDIIECVKNVWQSILSERAMVYLKTKNIPMRQVKMAVLVQEMIPADVSGVMFTANVVNKNTDEILINATWGLGDALVSGKIVPDTYILKKYPLSVVQRALGRKEFKSIPETNRSVMIDTPREKREIFSLDDQTLHDIAEIGVKIEEAMECPQDIEWCIKPDGGLVILQSRPITTLSVP